LITAPAAMSAMPITASMSAPEEMSARADARPDRIAMPSGIVRSVKNKKKNAVANRRRRSTTAQAA
jgi:hypothetical protein